MTEKHAKKSQNPFQEEQRPQTPPVNPTEAPSAPQEAPVHPEMAYETFDGDEAMAYQQAGGHVVYVTARYPSKIKDMPSMKAGKRYRFLETKAQLDALLAAAKAAEEVA